MSKSKKSANHLHRYKKVNLAGPGKPAYEVYRCMKPACTHYVPLPMAEGKLCECCRCFQPMVIGKIQLGYSGGKPQTNVHCNDCIKRKNPNENNDAIKDFLKDVPGLSEKTEEGTNLPIDTDDIPVK